MRQMMLADDNFDIDSEIVFIAKDLEDAALGILSRSRPIGDLHVNSNAFQIVPLGASMCFRAHHAMGIQTATLAR